MSPWQLGDAHGRLTRQYRVNGLAVAPIFFAPLPRICCPFFGRADFLSQ
jgi:hypothetical protein